MKSEYRQIRETLLAQNFVVNYVLKELDRKLKNRFPIKDNPDAKP